MNAVANATQPWAWPWSMSAWRRALDSLDTLHHGLLITGQSGIAKREFGLALCQALLCEAPVTSGAQPGACGECRNCFLFNAGTHPDFHALTTEREWRDGRLKLVAAYCDRYQDIAAREKRANPSRVIPIDQVRRLIDNFHARAHTAARKVALILPADRMNINAANALLKLLEEPPDESILILLTATPGYLPATIRSRCFQIAIAPPDFEAAREWLRGRLVDGGGDPPRHPRSPLSGGGDGGGDGDVAGDGDGDAGAKAAKVSDADLSAAERALSSAGPVDVLQMHADGFLQHHAQLANDLNQLMAGKVGALEIAAQWSKHDFARTLDYLHRFSADLAKTACGAGDNPDITRPARPLSPANLFKFYEQIGNYRKISREPLNEQLALEELLLALREALIARR